MNPGYTAQARAVLGDGRVARSISQMVVLDTDPVRAREVARGALGFLAQVTGYREQWARLGFAGSEIDSLDDRLVDDLVAWESRR